MGGGAGEVGAGVLLGAAVCWASAADAMGAAAIALKNRLRFIVSVPTYDIDWGEPIVNKLTGQLAGTLQLRRDLGAWVVQPV